MMQNVEQNLKSLGIELPTAPSPAANYVPFVKVGNFYTFLDKFHKMRMD